MSDYSEAYDYLERQAVRQPFCVDEAAHISAHHDDALTFLRTLPDASVHAVITDPPYGLADHKPERVVEALTAWASGDRERVPTGKGFMGREWDSFVPPPAVWDECLRVLKPGGHLAVFAGSRTVDLMGLSIRLAGFEMRDGIAAWLYGSGFPKSLDVGKAIDKRPGVERHPEFGAMLKVARLAKGYTNSFDVAERVVGARTGAVANWEKYQFPEAKWWPALRDLLDLDPSWDAVIAEAERAKVGTRSTGIGTGRGSVAIMGDSENRDVTAPATDAAHEWQGWGTALKPAHEPILLARKPLDGTVAGNVLAHGAGGLNIDACRVGTGGQLKWESPRGRGSPDSFADDAWTQAQGRPYAPATESTVGRWPTNVVLAHHPDCGPGGAPGPCVDGCQVAALDTQSGWSKSPPVGSVANKVARLGQVAKGDEQARVSPNGHGDTGGASRFFPTFRYQAKAPKSERPIVDGVGHPTVKPLGLMQWLVRLLVPEGGTVLDPFAGSGATLEAARLEGVRATGVERDEHSCKLIAERLGATTLEPIVGVADPADELLTRVHAAGSVDELMELYRQAVAEQLWCDEIKTVFTARKMAVAS